jgi:hypothetical protein
LGRFKLQDRTDISALLNLGEVDMDIFPLTQKQRDNFVISIKEQED